VSELLKQIVERFAAVACPPEAAAAGRIDGVIREFWLLRAALPPATRRSLGVAFIAIDQGARLYPRSRGRRFARLDDDAADAYLRALLARRGGAGLLAQRLKSVLVMCYYELPEVKREIGYLPEPYIAAVSRRRLDAYGDEIRAAEAAQ
jgi:hypothetical protein